MNNIIPRPVAKQNVYVIKRKVTNTLFSMNHGRKDVVPSVLAFKDKRDARKMWRWISEEQARNCGQKVVIEQLPMDYLVNTCKMTCLDLVMIGDKSSNVMHFRLAKQATIDDARFNLENMFMYYQ